MRALAGEHIETRVARLIAEVAGHHRLIDRDDAGTLAQPNDTEPIAPKLSAQHGREPPATACWSHLLVPWLPCVVPWGSYARRSTR